MSFEQGGGFHFDSGNSHEPFRSGHNSNESYKERRNRMENEKLEILREKFSKEFPHRPLHVKSVSPEKYTSEMKGEDLKYISEWKEYNLGRIHWLQDELSWQYHQRLDSAKDYEERMSISDWYFKEKDEKFKEKDAIFKQWEDWHSQIFNTHYENLNKKQEEKAQGSNQNNSGQNNQNSSSSSENEQTKKPSGNNAEKEKTIEQIAISELGISLDEYNLIISANSRLSENQIILLAEKIFGVSNGRNGQEVKKAYQKCASKWHPDKSEESTKDINAIKFQIVNNFYNKHYKLSFDN